MRWVQYDVPLFVRVQPDEEGWGTTTPMVVLVTDPEHMPLARDVSGHFLVYDENFERIGNLDLDVRLDGIRGAVSVAEDKGAWPDHQHIIALGEKWLTGPDPRLDPDYYLGDGVFDALDAQYAELDTADAPAADEDDLP